MRAKVEIRKSEWTANRTATCDRSRGSDHQASSVDGRISLAERSDYPFAATFRGPQVDEQHLIFVVLNDFAQGMTATGNIDGVELALEDRVLQVVAEISHRFEDAPQSLRVANIVSYQVGISHEKSLSAREFATGKRVRIARRNSQRNGEFDEQATSTTRRAAR
jgi:hypothetical protein